MEDKKCQEEKNSKKYPCQGRNSLLDEFQDFVYEGDLNYQKCMLHTNSSRSKLCAPCRHMKRLLTVRKNRFLKNPTSSRVPSKYLTPFRLKQKQEHIEKHLEKWEKIKSKLENQENEKSSEETLSLSSVTPSSSFSSLSSVTSLSSVSSVSSLSSFDFVDSLDDSCDSPFPLGALGVLGWRPEYYQSVFDIHNNGDIRFCENNDFSFLEREFELVR